MVYDVTVLVNSYKEKENVFCAALDSIFAASPKQVIVSTVKDDECIKWLERYDAEVVVNEKPGIYEQINAMIPHIKGRYVCYASANDIMYPDKLLIETGMLNSEKKVCYSAFHIDNKIIKTRELKTFPDRFIYETIFNSKCYISDCSMVETEMFMRHMPFRTKYGNQGYRDLWLRIYEEEGDVFIYNPKPTWLYVVDDNSRHIKQNRNPELKRKREREKSMMLEDHAVQLHISGTMNHFKRIWSKRKGFIPYTNKSRRAIFYGLYTSRDYHLMRRHTGRLIVVWCGNDARKLTQQNIRLIKSKKNIVHIAKGKYIAEILTRWGIKHHNIPVSGQPFDIEYKPLGDKIFHYGNGKNDFYGDNYIDEIEKRTGLKVIRTTKDTHSREQLLKIYEECFMALRLTKTDGLPNTVLEAGLMGRKSIYNGGLPHCIPWTGIDDICENILKEYNERDKDHSYIANDYYKFLDIGMEWTKL